MRTTSHEVKKLITYEDKYDPRNPNGRDLAEVINGLIEITGADQDPIAVPDVPPAVVVDTVYNPNFPYLVGSEIRTPFGFFRCTEDMPANNNISLTDKNHWDLFYLPSETGNIFGGEFDETQAIVQGEVLYKVEPDRVLIIKAVGPIEANTPYDPNRFTVVREIMSTGGNATWKGQFSELVNYDGGDIVYIDNVIYQANNDLLAGAFNPAAWTVLLTVYIPSYKGNFDQNLSYKKGDLVTFIDVNGYHNLYVANDDVPIGVFSSTQWTLRQQYKVGGKFRGDFSQVISYNPFDVVKRINADGDVDILEANTIIVAGPFIASQWNVKSTIPKGGEFRGDFSPALSYGEGDVAFFDDGTGNYRVLTAKADIAPGPLDLADWDVSASFTKPALHVTKAIIMDTLLNDEEVYVETPIRDFKILSGGASISGVAETAATSAASLIISKGSTPVGRLNWSAGETTATVVFAADVTFTTSDTLVLLQDGTADETLANITVVIEGLIQQVFIMEKFLYIQNEADSWFRKDDYPSQIFSSSDSRTIVSTSNAHKDVDYQRSVDVNNGQAPRKIDTIDDPTQDIWIHWHGHEDNQALQLTFFPEGEYFGSGSAHLSIVTSTSNSLAIFVEKSSFTRLYENYPLPSNDYYNADVKLNLTSGAWAVYIDGSKRGEGVNNKVAELNPEDFVNFFNTNSINNSAAAELIITQGIPTIGMRLIELPPESLGTENDLSGNLSDINTSNLTEAAMTTAASGSQTFSYEDVKAGVDLTDMEVRAVAVSSIVSSDELFEDNFAENAVKIGGTLYKGDGMVSDTNTDARPMKDIMTVNPATGAKWTIAEINALEAGVSYSVPPLVTMIVGRRVDDDKFWGVDEVNDFGPGRQVGRTLGVRTPADVFYQFMINSDNNTFYMSMGPSGNDLLDGSLTSVNLRMVAEDGTVYSEVIPKDSGSDRYTIVSPGILAFFQAQLGKRIQVYAD